MAKSPRIATALKPLTVPIDSLVADEGNVRKHSNRNLTAIRSSLRRFGQVKPIVVSGDGETIVAGNGTYAAAIELGWTEIAAVKTKLKDNDATAYAIADNRTAELADWDYSALADQLKTLQDDGVELPDIGWDPHEFEPLLQSDFDPRMTAYGGDGESESAVRSLKLTVQQREALDKAIASMRVREDNESLGEGQCVELICVEWLG